MTATAMIGTVLTVALVVGYGLAAPSPAQKLTSTSRMVGEHNVTTMVIPHGQSYTIQCPKVATPPKTTAGGKSPRRLARSAPKPATPSKKPSSGSPSSQSAQGGCNPPKVEADPTKRVRLDNATYAKKGCAAEDVTSAIWNACISDDMMTCVIRANDPSKKAGCQQRPLTIEFSCAAMDTPQIACGMVVNNMFDK